MAAKTKRHSTSERAAPEQLDLAHFKAVIEGSGDAIFTKSLAGTILSWNPSSERVFGWKAKDVLGKKAEDILVPKEKAAEELGFREDVARGKSVSNRETLRLRADGETIICSVSLSPVYSRTGRIQAISSVARDVTHQVKQVRLTENLLKMSPLGIVQLNCDLSLNYANPWWNELTRELGFTNQPWTAITHPTERARFSKQWEAFLKQKEKFSLDFRISAESERWLHAEAVSLPGEGNQILGYLITLQEITQRKKTELEWQNISRKATEMAEMKSAFLANMSHEIRTPLNAVIGMTSLLEEMDLGAPQREYVRTIKNSGNHLLEVINSILDFSKIQANKARLEQTTFSVRQVIDEAAGLFADSFAKKGIYLKTVTSPSVPPLIRSDPTRLRQILVNLIGNAIKFTQQGEVAVTCSIKEKDKKTATLVFQVSDTGAGIDLSKENFLFTPFSQIDSSTTRCHGGTGLGLAICKELSVLLGGDIELVKSSSQGTTFQFSITVDIPTEQNWLPSRANLNGKSFAIDCHSPALKEHLGQLLTLRGLKQATELQTPDVLFLEDDFAPPPFTGRTIRILDFGNTAYQPSPNQAIRVPIRQGELYRILSNDAGRERNQLDETVIAPIGNPDACILVAEDNPVNQKLVGHMLDRLGVRYHFSSNGKEAVAACAAFSYQAILMDCHMPEVDGYQAALLIRQSGQKDIPIIALTANAQEENRKACKNAGMNGFIAKPFRLKELAEVLGPFLNRNASEPASELSLEASQGLLDEDYLRELSQLRSNKTESILSDLLDTFLQSAPDSIAQLKAALFNQDLRLLHSQAHKLKGGARNLGFVEVARLCEYLESTTSLGLKTAETIARLEPVTQNSVQEYRAFSSVPVTNSQMG